MTASARTNPTYFVTWSNQSAKVQTNVLQRVGRTSRLESLREINSEVWREEKCLRWGSERFFVPEMTGRKMKGIGPWIEHRKEREKRRIKVLREKEWCRVRSEGGDFPIWIHLEPNTYVYSSGSCKRSHLIWTRISASGLQLQLSLIGKLMKRNRITQLNMNLRQWIAHTRNIFSIFISLFFLLMSHISTMSFCM